MAVEGKSSYPLKLKDKYDSISPIDYRYEEGDVVPYMGENGLIGAMLEVESALVTTAYSNGLCDIDVVNSVMAACQDISTAEVYDEENRTKHDIRALVNTIRKRVPDSAKPFVHLMATSFDIRDTATALRFQRVTNNITLPSMMDLERALIQTTLTNADIIQIGRTHGQHAVPITFGFAMAEYVSRFGSSIESLMQLTPKLVGKFSGAVGAYNASSLLFENPIAFEAEILNKLGLKPADHSTQIVQPEPLLRVLNEHVIAAGIIANLARDMRNLQRTEIGEVGEEFEEGQVGSSTMTQKQNPINWENVESVWKILMPKMVTIYMDQISEHQRDLTNSASSRTYPEIVNYAVHMFRRATRVLRKLQVNPTNMAKNLNLSAGQIAGEPLYILLAYMGHPDAHEKSRVLALNARRKGVSLGEAIQEDPEANDYLRRMTKQQGLILLDPGKQYTGEAEKTAKSVAESWKERLPF